MYWLPVTRYERTTRSSSSTAQIALAGPVVHDPLAGALSAVGRHGRRIVARRGHRRQRGSPAVRRARCGRRRVDHERLVAGPDAERGRRPPADDAVVLQVFGCPGTPRAAGVGGVVERSADRAGVEARRGQRLLDALDRGPGVAELDRGDLERAAVEFDRRLRRRCSRGRERSIGRARRSAAPAAASSAAIAGDGRPRPTRRIAWSSSVTTPPPRDARRRPSRRRARAGPIVHGFRGGIGRSVEWVGVAAVHRMW